MSEIILPLASAAIGATSGAVGAYVMLKRALNIDSIMPIIEDLGAELMTNKELQEKIYVIGGILGKGIGAGVGLSPKSGGKFKTNDLIGMLAQQFLPQILGKVTGLQPQQANEQQTDNQLVGIIPQ